MPKHLNIIISGRVQGVGFRRAARDQARYLGVKGFVKNEMDGTVYIEAEGDDSAIAMFVQWCRQGSSFAMVEKVTTASAAWVGFPTFESRY